MNVAALSPTRIPLIRQAATYVFIGGIAAIADLFLLFILVDLVGMYYLLAAATSFVMVATIAFFAHKKVTFRNQASGGRWRYAVFLAAGGSGICWSLVLLYLFVDVFAIWYLEAALFAKAIVFGWNFSINKWITFRGSQQRPG